MSELVTTRIRGAAARLHLANVGENLEALVARAESSTMDYLEFLDLVLDEETGIREGRRFRKRPQAVGPAASQDPRRVRLRLPARPRRPQGQGLGHPRLVESRANVAFLGPPRVGKTMLAVGLAIAACQAGFSRDRSAPLGPDP